MMSGFSRIGAHLFAGAGPMSVETLAPATAQAIRRCAHNIVSVPQDSNTSTRTKSPDIASRTWVARAIQEIRADSLRSSDTHLHKVVVPSVHPTIRLYLKDESTHPTGSLKHRLARSLFLYGLCNGNINEHSTIIESSSGSTAISEAYFANLLRLPFIAVVPRTLQPEKVAAIEFWGGKCHFVDDPSTIYSESARLAKELDGHYMDQFTNAEKATDWKGNNNIAESTFEQMRLEPYPIPTWIVVGAGTGGTATTFGRHCRYSVVDTCIAVVDPENSVFFDHYVTGQPVTGSKGSAIEGIGRPRVEPSFMPQLVDCMIKVPDSASFAAMKWIYKVTGRFPGPSSGTNLYGCLKLMAEMHAKGQKGSIITLLCDSGERYRHTCHNDTWLRTRGFNTEPYLRQIEIFWYTGKWEPVEPNDKERIIEVYDI
eukprot:comp19278_c0_seq1/m.22102 comp19278_c0_seq1/g.22102  ORF comp19278_c0_seq1/g.22102 comp19278_c0_seq1/m.22102 type:complete len:427 (-) comp19278_c0_seq1:74-1354(-)